MRSLFLIGCMLFMLITACESTLKQEKETNEPISSKAAESQLRIFPSPLFEGKEEKYKAFLGTHAAAVALQYEGNGTGLQADLEIWEKGKIKQQKLNSMTIDITDGETQKGKFQGELIVSAKEESLEGQTPKYVITSVFFQPGKGYSSVESRIDKNPLFSMQSPIHMQRNLTVPETESVAVWGLQATDENSMSSSDSFDETIKQAKWALVVRVTVVDGTR